LKNEGGKKRRKATNEEGTNPLTGGEKAEETRGGSICHVIFDHASWGLVDVGSLGNERIRRGWRWYQTGGEVEIKCLTTGRRCFRKKKKRRL